MSRYPMTRSVAPPCAVVAALVLVPWFMRMAGVPLVAALTVAICLFVPIFYLGIVAGWKMRSAKGHES